MFRRPPSFPLLATLLSFLIIAAVAGLGLRSIVRKSLPRDGVVVETTGLQGEVDITWDDRGVPHVSASSDEDLYFGLGYAQAVDRLWQMDYLRRMAQGRLAEILGSSAIRSDKCMRTMGFSRIADSLYLRVSPETRTILAAYAAGVNAGIQSLSKRLPIEFDLLQYTPEPWNPRHSLLVQRFLAWRSTPSLEADLLAIDLESAIGRPRALHALTLLRTDWEDSDSIRSSRPPVYVPSRSALLPLLESWDLGGMAWILPRERSASGAPILSVDLYGPPELPARWSLVHLSAPGINAVGALVPGVPALQIGRNPRLAWGSIPSGADEVDLVRESISLADSLSFVQERTHRLRMGTDSILVRHGRPVVLTTAETENGPLLLPALEDAGRSDLRPGTRFYSVRWTGRAPSDEILAFHRLLRARSTDEGRAALASCGAPSARVLLTDLNGNTLRLLAGRTVVRSLKDALFATDADQHDGWILSTPDAREEPNSDVLPVIGTGPEPGTSLTSTLPFCPLVGTADQKQRLRTLLSSETRLSRQDMHLVFYDETATPADTLRHAFVAALLTMPGRPIELTRVMNQLDHWDLRLSVFSSSAAVFATALRLAHADMVRDEMGEALAHRYLSRPEPSRSLFLHALGDSVSAAWWDDGHTASRETKENILRKSLVGAVRELQQSQGLDSRRWMWGALRSVTFRHPLWNLRSGLDLLNIGPLAFGGGPEVLHYSWARPEHPRDVVVCSVLRMVCDLSRSEIDIMLPSGTSGQSFSSHYADQTVLWQSSILPSISLRGPASRDLVHRLRRR